jgi:hypothetical protein
MNANALFTDICKNDLPKITTNKEEFIHILTSHGINVNNSNTEAIKRQSPKRENWDDLRWEASHGSKKKLSLPDRNSNKP